MVASKRSHHFMVKECGVGDAACLAVVAPMTEVVGQIFTALQLLAETLITEGVARAEETMLKINVAVHLRSKTNVSVGSIRKLTIRRLS